MLGSTGEAQMHAGRFATLKSGHAYRPATLTLRELVLAPVSSHSRINSVVFPVVSAPPAHKRTYSCTPIKDLLLSL